VFCLRIDHFASQLTTLAVIHVGWSVRHVQSFCQVLPGCAINGAPQRAAHACFLSLCDITCHSYYVTCYST
jgi:hypothetical protein